MSHRALSVGLSVLIAAVCWALFSFLSLTWWGQRSGLPDALNRLREDPIPRIDTSGEVPRPDD